MAPKTPTKTTPVASKTTTPVASKTTTPVASKTTTPVNSRPGTPVSDFLGSEKAYKPSLDPQARTALDSLVNKSFPNSRIVIGTDEDSGQHFVRVYASGTSNILAFMHASDIRGAFSAVTAQLGAVADIKGGKTISQAKADSDPYLKLYSKALSIDKTATFAWTLSEGEDDILHKFTITLKKGRAATATTVVGGPDGLSNAATKALLSLN